MTKLTNTNYYDKGTKALTCSKIKDFTVCPNYFFRKHIKNEIEDEQSDAFMIGGLVDKLLSGEDFGKKYEIVARRTTGAKLEAQERGITLMLQSQLDEIIEIADAVDKTDAWREIKAKGTFQDILQVPMTINEHFDSLAGKPDCWWLKDNETCVIVDLKTAASADHRKYYYQAMGFKYDWQLAMYKFLLKGLYPEIKHFECYNLVVSKTKNIYGVELFKYQETTIMMAESAILNIIDLIKEEKEYKKYNPTFSNPVLFGDFSDEESSTGEWIDRDEKGE